MKTLCGTWVLFAVVLAGGACSSSNGRGGPGIDGGAAEDLLPIPDAYFVDEPAPMCALDGTVFPPPPPPGGTDECPADKNREGCECPTEGASASCWPGARKNRGLGICKDGMTTCTRVGELSLVWGPCDGYVLPDPNATDGARACKCFSHGSWKLDNLSPCFIGDSSGGPAGSGGAISTVPGTGGTYVCPADISTKPTANWATDTVTADCSGRFKLCLTLKAGAAATPKTTDCIVSTTCVTGDYIDVNKAQAFPPLPAWITNSSQTACAQKFATSGGYGEMSVDGETVTCDKFNRVFNRVGYCPLSCNTNPTDPACAMCAQGGSGNF